ncbi:hypothetical protein B0H16DRAFT_1538250 [Mycena metata]|uniref:Uncharacterized protein n=1 Tax=Mycena metata TaxID=1033252 RepID=A0AAD7MPF7_9AGAR|nr:hypothetical protein B0H16DRAFT_1591588 [Mycena metata]KAJ7757139.1 hypothetical protein B0H16DRAFT_1538250 [Mycena metata]
MDVASKTAARVLCFLRLLHARRAGLDHLPPGKAVARVAFLCSMSSRNNCWCARSSPSWDQGQILAYSERDEPWIPGTLFHGPAEQASYVLHGCIESLDPIVGCIVMDKAGDEQQGYECEHNAAQNVIGDEWDENHGCEGENLGSGFFHSRRDR